MVNVTEVMTQSEQVSQVLKLLSHPGRLKILCALIEGEKTVNELTELCELSQSASSQFLARMKAEGLLDSRRESHFVYYQIQDLKIKKLIKSIKEIFCK